VAVASKVMPPDTIEHDDQMCDLTDPLSVKEETLFLSIIKDTSGSANAARSTGIRDTVLTAVSKLSKHYVPLDTCGSAKLLSNREMVSNIREAEYGLIIDGVHQEGDTIFGKVH
jgi:hypothetical protein